MAKRFLNYEMSNYSELTNMPIGQHFTADDEGVSIGGFGVCEPISITSISINRETNEEFVELEYYIMTDSETKIIKKTISAEKITSKDGQKLLTKTGFIILDTNKFNNFIGQTLMVIKQLHAKKQLPEGVKVIYGSAVFGFEEIDGLKNYKNFYGINLPVIPTENMEAIDNLMFKKKGSLEGFIDYLDLISSTSKCKKLIQFTVSMGLTGITRQFLGGTVPVPEYLVQSPTGSGKGFLQNIIAGEYGRIAGSGIIYSGSSSAAGMKPIKAKLNVIPAIYEDIQQKVDNGSKTEIDELRQLIYEHTNGVSTKKANSDGTVRGDDYTWNNPLIMYCEKELPDNIKDGAANRYVMLRSGLRYGKSVEQEYIWGTLNKNKIDKKQHENYGWYAPEFISQIVEYNKRHDISEEFNKIEDKIDEVIQANSKKLAGLYGLLLYTYNLLYKFKMLPETWEDLTVEDITEYYDNVKINSSDEQMYEFFKDRITSQLGSYIPLSVKLTQKDYDDRRTNGNQVRGRIQVIEKDGMNYTTVLIPKSAFDENIKDLAKRHDFNYKTNIKSWVDNGWLITTNDVKHNGYAVRVKNITYEYNAIGEGVARKPETCYQIIIDQYESSEKKKEKIEEELQAIWDKVNQNNKSIDRLIENPDLAPTDMIFD